jgi:Fe-S-cluster containining protein
MQVERYDTVDRIISNIVIPISREPVNYKGVVYQPKKLRISASIFNSLICPENCGGCCWRSVTLDWFPHENAHPAAVARTVEVNGRSFGILSLVSEDPLKPCQFLDGIGRCKIYNQRPFLCDFSFIRIQDKHRHYTMMNSTPSRGFHLKRVDGGKGNACHMTEIDEETLNHRLEQFLSLKAIVDYFQIDTWVDEIIAHIRRGPTHLSMDFDPGIGQARLVDFIGEE